MRTKRDPVPPSPPAKRLVSTPSLRQLDTERVSPSLNAHNTLHKALHHTKQQTRRDRRALHTRPGVRAAGPQRATRRRARSPCRWRRCAPGGKRRGRRSYPPQGVAGVVEFRSASPPQVRRPRPVTCVEGAEEKRKRRGRDKQKVRQRKR